MTAINDTLFERERRYGSFTGHARIAQNLKGVMWATPKWEDLPSAAKEALEMVQHKVARILNGDPTYTDNWHDIAGYATLVENDLTRQKRPTTWTCSCGHPDLVVGIGEKCPICDGPSNSTTTYWTCHCNGQMAGTKVPVGESCYRCFATT